MATASGREKSLLRAKTLPANLADTFIVDPIVLLDAVGIGITFVAWIRAVQTRYNVRIIVDNDNFVFNGVNRLQF